MTTTALSFPDPALNDLLTDLTDSGVTLAQLQGVTDQELDATYRLGYVAYSAGNYSAALDVFRFLCTYQHMEARSWHGLAACQQALGAYEPAVLSYFNAALLGDDAAGELLHAADCCLADGDRDGALHLLHLVVLAAADESASADVRERAEALIDLLEQTAA